MASTCRAACNPWSDMKAWKSQTLTAQGFHLKEMIPPTDAAAVVAFLVKENNIKIQEKWRERKWEREHGIKQKDGIYTAVHCGTEPSCQACLDARPRPKFTTDLPPKLLMSNISRFPSLSFSAFTHAHSPGLSASTLDLISLSPLRCYGNQNLGITSLQLCDGSCSPTLQPLVAVSPPEGGNKDLSHIQDLNFSLVRRRDEPRLAFTH